MCKSWCEAVIALIIIVASFMQTAWDWTQWVIVIAALVLLIHSFTCKSCFAGHTMASEKSTRKARRR